ncbi:MAG: metabolite traffic protein EboE [Planctomycetes bacterium]|nr:metabolite traffic protein EboE [Planctomycetota bacterium]
MSPPARRKPPLHLGYSTNVHRGESLEEIYHYLRDYTIPIKERVFGNEPSGLELRLGIAAARELRRRERREELKAFLDLAGLELFSVNAFPLHDFQARRVKERVYHPPWTHRARARWTIAIARIFADLLPEGVTGSLSTLAGTYRFWEHGPRTFERLARNYLDALAALEDLEEETGKRLLLAAEPEPDTTLEVAEEVIRFYENWLYPAAKTLWRKRHRTPGRIEAALRRRFTVNLDTCHFSVLFHDPAQALADLVRAGLQVGKVHVTNALALRRPARSPRAYREFRGMNEPRYLHQFCGLMEGKRGEKTFWRGRDLDRLPEKLEAGDRLEVAELRTHFHVPIHLQRWRALSTTQEETKKAVQLAVRKGWCPHLVIETYTWPVLAKEDRLVDGIAREFRWLLQTIR